MAIWDDYSVRFRGNARFDLYINAGVVLAAPKRLGVSWLLPRKIRTNSPRDNGGLAQCEWLWNFCWFDSARDLFPAHLIGVR